MIISAFIDSGVAGDARAFLLVAPMTALFMLAVIANDCILVPRMLLRARIARYIITLSLISMVVPLLSLLMEYRARTLLSLPQRIADCTSPWILIDSLSSSMLLLMILSALGALGLVELWNREMRYETLLSERLKNYMRSVRTRLQSSVILSMLRDVLRHLREGSADCGTRIRRLSDYLRIQLYELPSPPVTRSVQESYASDFSRFTDFITSPRFSYRRHLAFQMMLLLISTGTLFTAPDRPEFTADRLVSAAGMYICLNLMAYINILWLMGSFKRNFNLGRYLLRMGCLIIIMLAPILVLQILTYDLNPYTRELSWQLKMISISSTAVTLLFFIGGVSGALLMKEWLLRRRRIVLLHAETVRQEFAFLRKQINPHFLFNVLNSIDILSVDDQADAISMSEELLRLLEYQFAETQHDEAPLRVETDFLRSYLVLEGMRLGSFSYAIDIDGDSDSIRVPTLLFIPIVENAVKYSRGTDGGRSVSLHFEVLDGRLTFLCVNSYGGDNVAYASAKVGTRSGGIGLSNTRRRLELLYSGNFILESGKETDRYVTRMVIPVG